MIVLEMNKCCDISEMLKKLKACCGCGSNDVVIPEEITAAESPDISHNVTINHGYVTQQTAPWSTTTNQPKSSDNNSQMSESS